MSCHYWQSTQGVRVKSACGPMSASVGADIREDLDLILGAFNAGGGGGGGHCRNGTSRLCHVSPGL